MMEKGEDTVLAVLGESLQIKRSVVSGREIDFEIAGVDDDADGRVDGEGDAIDQAVGDADGDDAEGTEIEALVGKNFDELGFVEQAMFFELAFNVSQSEFGAVDGDFELGEDPRQAADVVLMAVGEDDAADHGAIFDEIGDVGDDDVDAEQFGLGEHKAGIDDDDVVLPANGSAVHAELAEASQRDDLQLGGRGIF